jgi:ABC-type nitrate/sulfonate/bicarbonate transport system substrate-binding protein
MRTIAIVGARLAALLGVAMTASWAAAQGQPPSSEQAPPRPLRVIAFGGGHNLPIWAAQRQGSFEQNGVKVLLSFTPSSTFLVSSLFDGKSDIAITSVDNVIAYQEGQGETEIPANPDLFAFFGGDGGFLTLVTAPPVKTFADLRGRTLSVDAMTTGFAFVLREMLQRRGLTESDVKFVKAGGTPNRFKELMAGKQDGTLLRTPFELLAQDKGFHVLARGEEVGPYLGIVGVARRSWARENEAALLGFLRGYHEGLQFSYDAKNHAVAEAILVAHLKDMTPPLAKRSLDVLLDPKNGLFKDMALDRRRLETVLGLRSKYAEPRKELTDPGKYVDASYLAKALGNREASRP